MKSEFISVVSHELRTPLSLTREGLSLVIDEIPGKINEGQQKCLRTAMNNIDRLNRIIGDLLDVSKIESGKVELNKVQFDLKDVIGQVESIFKQRAADAGLALDVKLPQEPLPVFADRDRTIQIFTNLLANALKFTEKGRIEISAQARDGSIECVVSDTGIGIKEENIPHLFDKFRQFGRVHGPGDKGTGLGLAIVKGIVEMHGGSIVAESVYTEGSRFTVRLPRHDQAAG
jgi:signal transduction histidine kinase